MSKNKEVTLEKIINYLENNDCKVVTVDNSLYIYDVKKIQPVSHNKDLRLLNEMAVQYVKVKYPLFLKELSVEPIEVINKLFPYIKVDVEKFKKIKPFKKIIKRSLICGPKENGQVFVRHVIRRRNIS